MAGYSWGSRKGGYISKKRTFFAILVNLVVPDWPRNSPKSQISYIFTLRQPYLRTKLNYLSESLKAILKFRKVLPLRVSVSSPHSLWVGNKKKSIILIEGIDNISMSWSTTSITNRDVVLNVYHNAFIKKMMSCPRREPSGKIRNNHHPRLELEKTALQLIIFQWVDRQHR